MSALRVLHVDDEPDIRDLVAISLNLDPEMSVRSCSSGADALTEATAWSPDLILIDVMMPLMDGPQTLGLLRGHDATARIPIVFMTARAQARELAHFLSLGAAGVIPKPFDPITLAATVKRYMRSGAPRFDELKNRFALRARSDVEKLMDGRRALANDADAAFGQIRRIAHPLSGAGATYGFEAIGTAAAALERMVEDTQNGIGSVLAVDTAIDQLLDAIDRDCPAEAPGNLASA